MRIEEMKMFSGTRPRQLTRDSPMPFGKYKGQPLGIIPVRYWVQLRRKVQLYGALEIFVQQRLEGRYRFLKRLQREKEKEEKKRQKK